MPWNRNKILPQTVHLWRGKNWNRLQTMEAKQGHGLKLVHATRQTIQSYIRHQTKANPAIIARGITTLISQLADELQTAEQQNRKKTRPWNAIYLDTLRHFWHEIPHSIRHEIIRQSKSN